MVPTNKNKKDLCSEQERSQESKSQTMVSTMESKSNACISEQDSQRPVLPDSSLESRNVVLRSPRPPIVRVWSLFGGDSPEYELDLGRPEGVGQIFGRRMVDDHLMTVSTYVDVRRTVRPEGGASSRVSSPRKGVASVVSESSGRSTGNDSCAPEETTPLVFGELALSTDGASSSSSSKGGGAVRLLARGGTVSKPNAFRLYHGERYSLPGGPSGLMETSFCGGARNKGAVFLTDRHLKNPVSDAGDKLECEEMGKALRQIVHGTSGERPSLPPAEEGPLRKTLRARGFSAKRWADPYPQAFPQSYCVIGRYGQHHGIDGGRTSVDTKCHLSGLDLVAALWDAFYADRGVLSRELVLYRKEAYDERLELSSCAEAGGGEATDIVDDSLVPIVGDFAEIEIAPSALLWMQEGSPSRSLCRAPAPVLDVVVFLRPTAAWDCRSCRQYALDKMQCLSKNPLPVLSYEKQEWYGGFERRAERFARGQSTILPGEDRWFVRQEAKRWREKCEGKNRRCTIGGLNADLVERREAFTHPRCVECRLARDKDASRQEVEVDSGLSEAEIFFEVEDCTCDYCLYGMSWFGDLLYGDYNNHNTDYNNYKTKGWVKRRSWLLHSTRCFRSSVRQFPAWARRTLGSRPFCPPVSWSSPSGGGEERAARRFLQESWSALRVRPRHHVLAWERQEEQRCMLERIAKNDVLKSTRLGSRSKSCSQSGSGSKRAKKAGRAARQAKSGRRGHADSTTRRRRENRLEAVRQAREEGVVV